MRPATAVFGTAFAFACIGGRAHRPAEAANILAIETVPGRSHWNVVGSAIGALTDAGHSVTAFTPFPDGDRENYTEVDMSAAFPIKVAVGLTDLVSMFSVDRWTMASRLMGLGRFICDRLHDDRRFRDVVAGRLSARFDAILVEPGIWDCVSYLVAAEPALPFIFVVPTVSIYLGFERHFHGDVSNPAVVSSLLSDRAVPRTFGQRLVNAADTLYVTGVHASTEWWLKTVDPRPYDSRTPAPPSLVFVNGHFVSDPAKPTPANVVNVGGLHLKPAGKIPRDILEFIENSPHGVILMTFGSTVKMASIPDNIQQTFKEVLAQLPQRVLLKYEEEMKNKPKNVMISKWFPQRDILEHPNVKLFISHCGISGLYEAINGGVPVLGFPLMTDQKRNIDNLVESGMAISMDIFSVTRERFSANILELINDKKYSTNAKKVSNIFKDRPITPRQSVVYWTEYVIRHKGAPHLRSQSYNLMWYQYFLLDVLAAVLTVVFIVIFVINKLTKIIFNYLFKHLYLSMKKKSE